MPAQDHSGYLRGLREELRGAKALGKSTVGEIESEIARVEGLLASRAEPKAVEHAVADPAVMPAKPPARTRK